MKLMGLSAGVVGACAMVVGMGAGTVRAGSIQTADYFPLIANAEWTASCFDGQDTQISTHTIDPTQVEIGGILTWKLQQVVDGEVVGSGYFSNSVSGILLHRDAWSDECGDANEDYVPEALVFLPATVSVGGTYVGEPTSWEGVTTCGDTWAGTWTETLTDIDYETVTVPAGTFEVLRFEWTADFNKVATDGSGWSSMEHRVVTAWSSWPGGGSTEKYDTECVIISFNVPAACLGDLDGDGTVGITDFLMLLAAWGPNPGHQADFDLDGTVGITDFLALLANWGACP